MEIKNDELIYKLEEMDKKIDILFRSDLLSKKIIKEHENRIESLENKIK